MHYLKPNTYYKISKQLKEFINLHDGRTPSQIIFTNTQLGLFFKHHITRNETRLFDERHKLMINCSNDPLGICLGVKSLHVTQIQYFISKQLTEVNIHNNRNINRHPPKNPRSPEE